ncbi:LOW QUALITY PROTEIN: glycine N-acyltransferase-like protein 2 [Sturnira hondurensis]|uniref:LOW QUALITY PROTEIN: glycine N-acyltransferase-like protein 2 n=1 Tax=Sturnira hondurensis TaxID=192404 RepID=UPI00187A2F26|nr:LOW QUALITY PROTEIN: glycine N-acyltransferase-like protein 2 [Sturnira hondurensis]
MFVTNEPQKLQFLYESLEKSIPESFKVYGAIFNIINKNPFNLEALVDAWPDYQIVIARPKKEEMKDDLDHYTNTYHIFTKVPDNLEVLACPQVINGEQAFQIQGCQENLREARRKVSASKSVQVDYMRTMLFSVEIPVELKTSSDDKEDLTQMFKISNMDEASREETFSSIFLDTSHARLVNEQWDFGKNERSLKYVECCLQNVPAFGVLGPEGLPVSWIVMEQSCELRMGYTVPNYRQQGNTWLTYHHSLEYLIQKKIPFYFHVAGSKEMIVQKLISSGIKGYPWGWHQWKCNPKKYC